MEAFSHVKVVIGIMLGLSIRHLLNGAIKFIQHPGRSKPYWIHLLWSFYVFLLLIHFWWWEIHLSAIKHWTFPAYFFIVIYIGIYYTLCALLYPDDVKEYDGFEAYYYSRKNWFFGVLAICFLADFVDTWIKGNDYFLMQQLEYPIRNIAHIILCLVAMKVNNKTFHAWLVILAILYELSFILRLFMVESV
ncbi:hypothetical protein [Chitinophaga defluvii]|uniref:Uncharacterized protein n=1 Tax=Chitinophaga defluvii TaxID=3163343 RepID=A0ABV2T4V9_9BACT